MKPKLRSLVATFAPLSRSSLIVCVSLCAVSSSYAAKTWSGTTDANWATLTNWVEGALPGTTETVNFNSSSTANLTAIALGANRTVRAISLTTPTSDVTIAGGSTLTLVNGIDMSGATSNFTVNCGVSLGGSTLASSAQSWNVVTGRTLTISTLPVRNSGANDLRVGGLINLPGAGVTKLGTAALSVVADGGGNPFVTINDNDWAATDATGTVITAAYTADAFTGNANIVTANTYAISSAAPSSIRFANTGGPVIVNNTGTSTLRGIIMTSGAQAVDINNNFIRPNRVSTAGATMSFIQNSTAGDLTINTNLGNASSSAPVALVKSGVGKMIISASQGYTGLTFIHAGTLQIGVGGTVGSLTSTNTITNNASLVVDRSDAITLSNVIAGTGTLTKNSAGTLTLGTANTFTGATTVSGGFVSIGAVASLGATSGITLNGGGIKWTAAADISTPPITIGASGTTFDTNGQTVTLANSIGNSGTGAMIKTGAGSLTLSGANLYGGNTTVNGGSLILNNLSGSGTGSGSVTVSNTATLGGAGTASGSVTFSSGSILAPGNSAVGTLNVGSLALDAGSTALFEFNTSPANDKVAVANSGGLTINGGAITLLQEGTATPFNTPGTYNLISYTGTIGGAGVSSLSVANPQAGYTYAFGTSGGFVTLTIATSGVVSEWGNIGGGSWATAGNWTNSIPPNTAGATANMLTAITGPATVTLDGGKTIGAITFNNVNSYTISQGTGGSLTINNGANPGAINVNNGSHEISTAITLNSSIAVFTASSNSVVLSGIVSGAADKTVTKSGLGSLSLLGANTFFGNLTLSAGTTTFANGGLGAGNLSIDASALVWATGNTQDISNRTITFGSGAVVFDTNGNNVALANSIGNSGTATFTKAGSGSLTFASTATFTGSTTISAGTLQLGNGGSTGLVSGTITDSATLAVNLVDASSFGNLVTGTGSFVHAGSGSLSLIAQNTFNGTTTIPSLTASLILTDSLNLQNSTLDYVTSGSPSPTAGGSLNFGTLTAAALGGLSGNKNLVLENTTPAAVTLTTGNNGLSSTYSGGLSGLGALTKIGAGVFTLAGASNYSGATNVNAGTLQLGAGGSVSGTTLTVAPSGTFVIADSTSSLALSGLLNLNNSTGGSVVSMLGGTATLSGGIQALNNANQGYRIEVDGGTLSTTNVRLGRGSLSFTTEGLAVGSTTQGLYVNGGTVSISGVLEMAVNGSSNSSVSTFVNNGVLNVGGKITVGLNNGGRWSVLQISNGELNSTDTVDGLVLGGPTQGNALYAVAGGISKVEKIQFGQGVIAGTSLLRLTGGELYVGSGGIIQSSINNVSEIRLAGGTLGAKAAWSTVMPINVSGASSSTIKAADSSDNPFDITLNGPLTGTGGVDKTGSGTLILSGEHSYTGNTHIYAGTLKVQGKTFADTSQILIASGATLNLDYSGGDKVAILEIAGDLKASGTWGAPGSGADNTDPALTGSGILYVGVDVPASPYDTWANSYSLPANSETVDTDKDSISNLLEFVLGGNPTISSTGILPTLAVTSTNFIFTFNRNDDSEAEVALTFEYGSNLSGWTPVAIGATTGTSGAGVTVDEGTPASNPDIITVTIPKGANTTLFGRLKAVKTP